VIAHQDELTSRIASIATAVPRSEKGAGSKVRNSSHGATCYEHPGREENDMNGHESEIATMAAVKSPSRSAGIFAPGLLLVFGDRTDVFLNLMLGPHSLPLLTLVYIHWMPAGRQRGWVDVRRDG